MIKYTPSNQLTLANFDHPFDKALDMNNRWVVLAGLIPWDELAGIYARNLDSGAGRLSVDIRMVIGALIIKHKLGLSDRETVDMISENIYMQYFCGLPCFQSEKPFDASLFVDIRERVGEAQFDAFNQQVIKKSEQIKPPRKRLIKKDNQQDKTNQGAQQEQPGNHSSSSSKSQIKNKGKLKLDASVADQYITYPNDLKLLNRSREESERLIDILYQQGAFEKKPRTYRRNARKDYLTVAKKRKKTKKQLRVALGKQLRYLSRNLGHIDKMLDHIGSEPFPLDKRDQKIYWVLQHIYRQQDEMYKNKTHSCSDRIVNIYQPYVRPMVRGKDKADVEFGSKINISEVDGFVRINHLSWDNYNEGVDLKRQVEDFRQMYRHYPEAVLADKIYWTRENRLWLKDRNIRIVGKPLGRPSKESQTPYQRRKFKKENAMRNHVEGKFGQGKNAYGLNLVRAKRSDTSKSWVSAIFFVMNLVRLTNLAKDFLAFIVIGFYKLAWSMKTQPVKFGPEIRFS